MKTNWYILLLLQQILATIGAKRSNGEIPVRKAVRKKMRVRRLVVLIPSPAKVFFTIYNLKCPCNVILLWTLYSRNKS